MSTPAIALDATHDPLTQSWVASANAADTDFPIQNLPFGRFRRSAAEPWQIGVAIGDQVLDLHAVGLIDHLDMHRLMAMPAVQQRRERSTCRHTTRCTMNCTRWRLALPMSALRT